MSGIPYNRLQTVELTGETDNGKAVVIEALHYAFVVPCRDCKYADISYTHAAVTGELHCYGYLVESWDWYNDLPSDGVKVKPDGFCAWGERE